MSSLSAHAQCHEQACEGYQFGIKYGETTSDAKTMVRTWIKEWRVIARNQDGAMDAEESFGALKNASYWAGYYAGMHKHK